MAVKEKFGKGRGRAIAERKEDGRRTGRGDAHRRDPDGFPETTIPIAFDVFKFMVLTTARATGGERSSRRV